MKLVNRLRKGKPFFMVDIAVPRDLDPRIAELPNVFLYDIDDLQGIVEANLAERKRAAEEIGIMIKSEIVQFKEWLATLGVVPVISALRQKANHIQTETMASIENRMPNLTEREKKLLNKHTKSIVNQLLKDPIQQAKELAMDSKSSDKLELFQQILGIDEDVVKEKETLAKQAKDRLKVRAERNKTVQANLT